MQEKMTFCNGLLGNFEAMLLKDPSDDLWKVVVPSINLDIIDHDRDRVIAKAEATFNTQFQFTLTQDKT